MKPLISVRDVRKIFEKRGSLGGGSQRIAAVDGVTFDIFEGETLALVGESGCGKSTLARILVGLYVPSSGNVLMAGENVHSNRKAERHDSVTRARRGAFQMVFQDPSGSLNPRMRIGASVAEPYRSARRIQPRARSRAADVKAKTNEMLRRVGLDPGVAARYPYQLSGGQQQRACIARALIADPSLIVFDEAISSLDASLQTRIIELIARLQEEFNATYVFITHDLERAIQIGDRIAIMYLGKIVELLPASRLAKPVHPYTQALTSAVLVADPSSRARFSPRLKGEVADAATVQRGCRFEARCPHRQEICRSEEPLLRVHEEGHRVACHFAAELAAGLSSTSKTEAK